MQAYFTKWAKYWTLHLAKRKTKQTTTNLRMGTLWWDSQARHVLHIQSKHHKTTTAWVRTARKDYFEEWHWACLAAIQMRKRERWIKRNVSYSTAACGKNGYWAVAFELATNHPMERGKRSSTYSESFVRTFEGREKNTFKGWANRNSKVAGWPLQPLWGNLW